MINVFARQLTDDLASLVKQLDAVVAKNEENKMAGYVVLLSEDPEADEAKVEAFAKKHGIKNLPLTIFDGVEGPPNYDLAKEANVTVLLLRKRVVKANHAFDKGGLTDEAIQQVVADTAKILD